MEPSESQYLIINAWQTLELLEYNFYHQDTGNWYILTPSSVLPTAAIMQNGDVVPFN